MSRREEGEKRQGVRERGREGGGEEGWLPTVTSWTYSAGQHAASEPDSIALHVMSNHMYLNWFRLCSVCVWGGGV